MEQINTRVSQNIKKIRESKKLTLEQAAQATSVSRSMLAQIEKGEANPTISILWKIANGYKVSFTSLIEERSELATLIRKNEANKMLADDGRYQNYSTFHFDEKKSFESYRIIIEENGYLAAEGHMAGTEEYISVFSGSIEIQVLNEVYILHKGDSLRFSADVSHSYRNISEEEVHLNMLLYYSKV